MNQTIIKQLEDNTDLYNFDKVNILLVADGVKPAAKASIESAEWGTGEPGTPVSDSVIDEIQAILGELGQQSSIARQTHQHGMEQVTFFTARDQETLNTLIAADKAQDDLVLGDLYGFPATAVQAFINDDMLPMEDMPASIDGIPDEALAFLQHRLSRDNWREELEYLPTYAERVKTLSPKIYEEYLER